MCHDDRDFRSGALWNPLHRNKQMITKVTPFTILPPVKYPPTYREQRKCSATDVLSRQTHRHTIIYILDMLQYYICKCKQNIIVNTQTHIRDVIAAQTIQHIPVLPGFISARCNIYISCLCYDVSVRLSVTEVHWRIIANLGFKFRSNFTTHCGRGEGSSQQQHLALC